MILKLNDIEVKVEDLKNKFNLEIDGVSAYDIIKIAKEYGLDAEGYKAYELNNCKVPFIGVIINENSLQHFVVILKVLKDKILIADPAIGISYISKLEFDSKYTKIGIVFSKKDFSIKNVFRNKKIILFIIFLTLIIALLGILSAYILSYIIKLLENGYNKNLIYNIILIFLIINIFKEIINYLREKISLKFRLLIDRAITIPTLIKLINLPQEFYQANGSGALISKVNDLSYVKEMLFKLVEIVFVNLFLIIMSLIVCIFINIYIFSIFFILVIILYFINKQFIKKHFYKTYELQNLNENLSSSITDIFICILNIKNNIKEKYFSNNIVSKYNNVLNKYKKIAISHQKRDILILFLMLSVNGILLFILVYKKVSIYQIMFILYLFDILTSSLNNIFSLMPLYADFKSTYNRVSEIFKKEVILNKGESLQINNINFNNLTYSYNSNNVLNNINFNINKGDWIMINGMSGGGKSTLFKLLTKQIKCDEVGIYVNGKNLNDYEDNIIRNSITYIDQKTRLFNKSIKENIFYGDNINDKPIKASMTDKLLKENNMNLDYVIDNTNTNLSGGQLQRIMIANALYNGKDVIIFDETTNQLDNKTEEMILKNIKNMYSKKTIILITHRNANEKYFDKIITIERGMIKKYKKRSKHESVEQKRIKNG